MNNFSNPLNATLDDAADFLRAGQTKEARQVLKEILHNDRNNLPAWELLLQTANNVDDELICLKNILALNPKHASAKKRYAEIRSLNKGSQPASVFNPSNTLPNKSPSRSSSRKKRQQATTLLILLGSFLSIMCIGITGFALYRGGYIPFVSPSNLTATALAQRSASCQVLIDKAIKASDNYCGETSSNKVCYGNTTIKAELAPGATQRFSERGDIVTVDELRRLSAAPLNLTNSEWGIAVFKVIANLPRSLPGETITMVVFGNTTLDKDIGNLESFYFSSELGQISCEKVPFDGLMITSPDGTGVQFTVNGAELTLMGDASLTAYKNGEMQVSLYNGVAKIISNGQEQFFGAGEKVTVDLGGPSGTDAIGDPSPPEPLTEGEIITACTMTGQYCAQDEITPVSDDEIQDQWQNQITFTPTLSTATRTRIPSPTTIPTSTVFVLPPSTPTVRATFTLTRTKDPTPTKTNGPSPTSTIRPTNTKPTRTFTPTRTPTPTRSITPSPTPVTFTPTITSTPTSTPGAPTEPICGGVTLSKLKNPNPNELGMNITNNSGSAITINGLFAYWVKSPNSQKLSKLFLNNILIWNKSDSTPPSDIPTEGTWKVGTANRTIGDNATQTLVMQFQDNLQSNGYEVHIIFNGCQVIGTK